MAERRLSPLKQDKDGPRQYSIPHRLYKTAGHGRTGAVDGARRPDAALVIESGAYIGWQGQAIGPKGLFAFCVDGSFFVRNVLIAEPEWTEYLKEPEAG
jgi:hypothetical protein